MLPLLKLFDPFMENCTALSFTYVDSDSTTIPRELYDIFVYESITVSDDGFTCIPFQSKGSGLTFASEGDFSLIEENTIRLSLPPSHTRLP